VLHNLEFDFRYCEEIVTFSVGGNDRNRGPLPNDGLRRFFISVERPSLTLTSIVRGMLRNHGCQTDSAVRRRYSEKVFSVLRMIALSLKWLHSQGFVHGSLNLESCGKFGANWKLMNLLGLQKIGETLDINRFSMTAPPEAVQISSRSGSEQRYVFRDNLVSHPSLDLWAFGVVAFEVLVGQPVIRLDANNDFDQNSWKCLHQWSDSNLLEIRLQLEQVGVSEAGIRLIIQCLSPSADARLSIDNVLQHSAWTETSSTH
jgi:serine/threonine protein kinase